jgi:hypothetical protein
VEENLWGIYSKQKYLRRETKITTHRKKRLLDLIKIVKFVRLFPEWGGGEGEWWRGCIQV